MGTLFVIEGVDGAGKATQTAKLVERLTADGKNPLKVTFPDYENKSSEAAKISGSIAASIHKKRTFGSGFSSIF